MTAAYWAQWDLAELMSMQDVELDEDHDINIDDMIEEKQDDECPCGYHCMDCLGLSWRDFM